MRPPSVSLFLFAAAFAFLCFGAFSVRQTVQKPAHDSTIKTHTAAKNAASDTPQTPDYSWTFNALDPGAVSATANAALFDPADDYWGLPRDDGVDLVAGYCIACHSLRIVMQQRASDARWRELMEWMIKKQGMAPPPEDDFEAIVRYLSENFGT